MNIKAHSFQPPTPAPERTYHIELTEDEAMALNDIAFLNVSVPQVVEDDSRPSAPRSEILALLDDLRKGLYAAGLKTRYGIKFEGGA